MNEIKPCPRCGKMAIKERERENITAYTYPPTYKLMWWCACGYREAAGTETLPTLEELRLDRWQRAQDGNQDGTTEAST